MFATSRSGNRLVLFLALHRPDAGGSYADRRGGPGTGVRPLVAQVGTTESRLLEEQ